MAEANADPDDETPTLKQHGDCTKPRKQDNPRYSLALSQKETTMRSKLQKLSVHQNLGNLKIPQGFSMGKEIP